MTQVEAHITESLRKYIRARLDQAGRINGEVLTPDPEEAMMNFLLIRYPWIDDFNRYEVLHELRSRADILLDGWSQNRRALVWQMMVASVLPIAGTCLFHYREAEFFRWGCMSIAYFVGSLAMIPLLYVASVWIYRSDSVLGAVSLRGFRCLAVVPIHYLLILIAKELPQLSYPVCFSLSLLFTVMSFVLAGLLERAAKSVDKIALPVWTIVVAGTVCFLVLRFGAERTFTTDVIKHLLQIGLCLLLIAPFPILAQQRIAPNS